MCMSMLALMWDECRWEGEWTGSEINVFVLRPPSCMAWVKTSASLAKSCDGETTGTNPAWNITPLLLLCAKDRLCPSFTSPSSLDPSLNGSHLRFVIDRTG